jgi:acylphosphatase
VSDARSIEAQRLTATVRGRVQGVGFRWFVRTQAFGLGLVGWAANQSDGSVLVVAEGESHKLDQFQAALGRGPAGASVDQVDAQRTPATGEFGAFGIRPGAHSGD